jgi:hypothetical protein
MSFTLILLFILIIIDYLLNEFLHLNYLSNYLMFEFEIQIQPWFEFNHVISFGIQSSNSPLSSQNPKLVK